MGKEGPKPVIYRKISSSSSTTDYKHDITLPANVITDQTQQIYIQTFKIPFPAKFFDVS